jgi:hypothetical protein
MASKYYLALVVTTDLASAGTTRMITGLAPFLHVLRTRVGTVLNPSFGPVEATDTGVYALRQKHDHAIF